MSDNAIKWRNWIREQEFDAIKDRLLSRASDNARLLEIGGGNGLQAKCLVELGFDVVSIDPQPRQPSHFPVKEGDSANLVFDDKNFDVIFSSNVLEHVVDLDKAFSEMKRVIKDGGIMIHTMPTHYSTIFTLAVQPIGYFIKVGVVLRYGVKFIKKAFSKKAEPAEIKKTESKGKELPDFNKGNVAEAFKMLNPVRLFISRPHGTSKNCFTEIVDWRPDSWQKRFEQAPFAFCSFQVCGVSV